jgi:hypothetical protein
MTTRPHRPLGLLGALAMWLSAAGQAQTTQLPAGVDIPPYPGAEVYPMGDRSFHNGQELRLYYFVTPAEPDQILAYYRERWEREGQIVSVHRGTPVWKAVGYLDLRDGKTRTVALLRQGKLTMGFPAVTDGIPMPLTSDPGQAGAVPVHPKADGLSTHLSLERGARFQTVNYSDPDSLADNEAFYLREMGQRGYHLNHRQAGKDDPNSLMLDFASGHKKMSVTLVWVPRFERCSVFAVTNQPDEQR